MVALHTSIAIVARTSWRNLPGSSVSALHSISNLPSSPAASSRSLISRWASSSRCSRSRLSASSALGLDLALGVPFRGRWSPPR